MPHATGELTSPVAAKGDKAQSPVWERPLGDSELSYFLPSRHEGINDMFVHIGFHAPPALFTPDRVAAVWAVLRTRHPLLGARIDPRSYDDVRFVYSPPKSAAAAIASARDNMEFRVQSKDDLVNTYLNGPRTLSNDRLSYVVVATPHDTPDFPYAAPNNSFAPSLANLTLLPPMPSLQNTVDGPGQEFHFLLAAPHCLGDGMALYRMSDEFFEMLASDKTDAQLKELVHLEWERAVAGAEEATCPIPEPLEARMPEPSSRLASAFEKVDYVRSQDRLIGGHSFPRPKSKLGPRHIVFPTYAFSAEKSKKVIKTCKAHGVSFSHALFALCNLAWARIKRGENVEQPMMMYSALNLRPYLPPSESLSYWFLSIGYFNVVLPSFFPRDLPDAERRIFWHRALQAKRQTSKYVGSPFLLGRSRQMGTERAKRAKTWAKEDDAVFNGLGNAAVQPKAPTVPAVSVTPAGDAKPVPAPAPAPKKPPSVALVGLSLLGDLDRVFHHDRYPSVRLHALTPGSRVRGGGTLLFGYTFAGKLWLNLPWDANGFDRSVIESFWDGLVRGVNELLLE
ncbi:hypothetical protein EXIGLDRAFT_712338 [Exidia glandulosa HHB12029]|uniref:CoA-dependent acyltransferase n=1 Tax=Exidia glandulosa HHB12029 TaxID=1314781 RepID=A0A165QA25_EXIGL|nr:hypothetical protein EXIGLDRAFT_712338 [Exidia glandulosa HHB12029]